MISKMKEITNLQIRQNGQQRKVWQTAKKNLVVLGNSLTVHFFWAQQFIGDTITQSPSWPENEKQYAVQTSRSTTTVTTLWDKQSHVYSSFENVHVYRRLNAINIRWHICTVDIHYLEGIRDKLSDWNGKQRHVWTVTCRRSFELSEICFLWVQVWIQVH